MDLLEFEPTKQDLLILREWISKMPYIVQDYDDHTLGAFVKAAKRRMQKVKILLENYNGLGYKFPKYMGQLDPLAKRMQVFLNANFLFPLPKKAEDGSFICMMVSRNEPDMDLSEYCWSELCRFWHMTMLVNMWEKNEGNTKVRVLHDCSNENFAKFKNLTPNLIKHCYEIVLTSPVRIQSIHIINIPKYLEPILKLIKSLASSKIANRFHFHSKIESLCEFIPGKILPKEYGGCEASVRELHDRWKEKVESYRDKLMETSEKMRKLDPIRPKSEGGNQELEGTFRQLHID